VVGGIVACCALALDVGCSGSDCPEVSAVRPCHSQNHSYHLAKTAKSHIPIRSAAQLVDATPFAIDLFSKGRVYDSTRTDQAFRRAEDLQVEPLEGGAKTGCTSQSE
jgi:hypothetical protein